MFSKQFLIDLAEITADRGISSSNYTRIVFCFDSTRVQYSNPHCLHFSQISLNLYEYDERENFMDGNKNEKFPKSRCSFGSLFASSRIIITKDSCMSKCVYFYFRKDINAVGNK